jgi:peptidyl-prolyl cis-trans isomerase A (cyclophilin A)
LGKIADVSITAAVLACVLTLVGATVPASVQTTLVTIETSIGSIDVEVDATRAPITAANFLKYVDAKMYDGGRFHRAVRKDNQVRKDVMIEVVQGGRDPASAKTTKGFGPIALERTSHTMLTHVDGAISMARGNTADSASSDFFICVGDQPSLDFGGARAADGQGFAAFGKVTRGMDVVRNIQAGATNDRESLVVPVQIVSIRRR